jgi:hypothetical protein
MALATALLRAPDNAFSQLPTKPRVPPGRDPGGIAVAVIDTGVNYLLPQIATRLARDGEGEMIGLDLEDGTLMPFDRPYEDISLEPAQRGTALASMILAEASRARLVAVRLKRGDPIAPARAASFVANGPARIVAVGVAGSAQAADWETFRQAALAYGDLLFIVAAGSGAKDLDIEPHYPQSFGLGNVMVVAAGDSDGRLLPDQNYGARTVDIVVPAVEVAGVNAEGLPIANAGERAAVARTAALAVRTSATMPALEGERLKAHLVSFAAHAIGEPRPTSRAGAIREATRINAGN